MWILLFLVGFFGFIAAIVALFWSFIKKNKELRKKSLIASLLCLIMFFTGVAISPSDDSESSSETAKTEQTSKASYTGKKLEKSSTKQNKKKEKKVSSSKNKVTKKSKNVSSKNEATNALSSKKKSAKKSANSKQVTSSSSKKKITKKSSKASSTSKTTSSSSSSTETSSSVKNYDDSANAAFASELNSKINTVLSQGGVTDSFAVMPNGTGVIDIVVPQDYKYLPNSQIQQLADTLLSAKNKYFSEWNAKPENNYDKISAPDLYVESPDGAVLAKESIWSGTMKRVIDNN